MEVIRWDSPEVKEGVRAIYNDELESALATFEDTTVARFALHRAEAMTIGAFLTQKVESLKECAGVLAETYKVVKAHKKVITKAHDKGSSTAGDDLRMLAEARLLEVEVTFFLSLSQLSTHGYIKGFMNLSSAHSLAKSLYSDFADKEEELGEELGDLIGFTIGWFWLYLSLLPEIIGPSASKIISWITGLQGKRAEGLALLNRVAQGKSIRKPLATLFLAAKYVFLADMDFPRQGDASLVLSDFSKGIELSTNALKEWPEGPFFLFLSSYGDLLNGEGEKAQPVLKKLSEKRISRMLWMNWGHSHMFYGDWDTALGIYHEIGANEDISDVYIAIICEGICNMMKGDREAAEERMKAASAAAGKSSQHKDFKKLADRYSDGTARYHLSYFEWKNFLRAFGSDEFEESLLDRLEQIEQEHGLLTAQSHSSGGWFGLKSSSKGAEIEDLKVNYLFSKAMILDHLKRHDEAIECYQAVVDTSVESHNQKFAYWFAAFHLAQLKYHVGARKEAVELLEKIKANCYNYRLVFSAKAALRRIADGEIEVK